MRFTNGAGPVTNPMRIPDENTWNTHHHPHQTNALLQHIDNKMGVTLEKLSNRNTRPSTSILNKLGRRGVLYCSQARPQTTVSNTEPWLCPHTHTPTPHLQEVVRIILQNQQVVAWLSGDFIQLPATLQGHGSTRWIAADWDRVQHLRMATCVCVSEREHNNTSNWPQTFGRLPCFASLQLFKMVSNSSGIRPSLSVGTFTRLQPIGSNAANEPLYVGFSARNSPHLA